MKKLALFFLLFPLSFYGQFNEIKEKYAPDKRTAVFDVRIENNSIKGETTSFLAKKEVLAKYPKLIDSLVVLPNEAKIGENKIGIVTVSVANMRSKPAESAELSSQVLLGTPVKILKKNGGWLFVQSPDRYLGWVSSSTLSLKTVIEFAQYQLKDKLIYTEAYGHVLAEAKSSAMQISDITHGNMLINLGKKGRYYNVEYPDGRQGYIAKKQAAKLPNYKFNSDVLNTAQNMVGVPYLWGGTSYKGVDCSGFTRMAYLDAGILLPRDASQQALVGDRVTDLKPGDLLFFGRNENRVVHVGIYVGNHEYIHSSGWVKKNSFSPQSEIYSEYNANRYLFAKRILSSTNLPYRLNNKTFYQINHE